MTLIQHVLSSLALVAGLILAYAAAFLYESEERVVTDRLAAWWIALSELSGGILPKGRAILQKAFHIADALLTRVMGEPLFSWRAVATGIAFDGAMLALMLAYIFAATSMPSLQGSLYTAGALAAFFYLGIAAFEHLRTRRAPTFAALLVIAFALYVGMTAATAYNKGVDYRFAASMMLAVFVQISPDFLIALIIRALLRYMGSRFPILTAIILPAAVALSLLGLLSVAAALSFLDVYGPIAMIFGAIPVLAYSMFVLLVPLVLVTGKVATSLFERLIYSAERFSVIKNKRFLWTMSIGLLLTAGVNWIAIIAKIFVPK